MLLIFNLLPISNIEWIKLYIGIVALIILFRLYLLRQYLFKTLGNIGYLQLFINTE